MVNRMCTRSLILEVLLRDTLRFSRRDLFKITDQDTERQSGTVFCRRTGMEWKISRSNSGGDELFRKADADNLYAWMRSAVFPGRATGDVVGFEELAAVQYTLKLIDPNAARLGFEGSSMTSDTGIQNLSAESAYFAQADRAGEGERMAGAR